MPGSASTLRIDSASSAPYGRDEPWSERRDVDDVLGAQPRVMPLLRGPVPERSARRVPRRSRLAARGRRACGPAGGRGISAGVAVTAGDVLRLTIREQMATGRGVVERHLERDGGEVAVLQRDRPARADPHVLARRRATRPGRGSAVPARMSRTRAYSRIRAVGRKSGSSSTKSSRTVASGTLTIVWPTRRARRRPRRGRSATSRGSR